MPEKGTAASKEVNSTPKEEKRLPKEAKSIQSSEGSTSAESSKHAGSKSIQPFTAEATNLPEEGLTAWQLGPKLPGTSVDTADNSPEGLLPEDADKDSSEPLLQDLFTGLEQRAVRGVNDAPTRRSPGMYCSLLSSCFGHPAHNASKR